MAARFDWPIHALIHNADTPLSTWAENLRREIDTLHVAMSDDLLRELGGKNDETPELIAVAGIPSDDLSRIPVRPGFLGMVFDRPNMPGNIGTLTRSIDAFGGAGLIVTGHAADPYDPKSVRASTGSLFTVPIIGVPSYRDVLDWTSKIRRESSLTLVGTDEHGDVDVFDYDFSQPTLMVVGNETTGMSTGWRESCDVMIRVPMTGTASSLNAASAGTVVLYEAARQRARRNTGRPEDGETPIGP